MCCGSDHVSFFCAEIPRKRREPFGIIGVGLKFSEQFLILFPHTEGPVADDLVGDFTADLLRHVADRLFIFPVAAGEDHRADFEKLSDGTQVVKIPEDEVTRVGDEPVVPFRLYGFHVQHDAFRDPEDARIRFEIEGAVGIDEAALAEFPDLCEELDQELVLKCAFSTRRGHAFDVRGAFPDLEKKLVDGHPADLRGGIVRTDLDAGVAAHAFPLFPDNFARLVK